MNIREMPKANKPIIKYSHNSCWSSMVWPTPKTDLNLCPCLGTEPNGRTSDVTGDQGYTMCNLSWGNFSWGNGQLHDKSVPYREGSSKG
ncbi:unnamed protein product, partial [Medioppia subpectinata]